MHYACILHHTKHMQWRLHPRISYEIKDPNWGRSEKFKTVASNNITDLNHTHFMICEYPIHNFYINSIHLNTNTILFFSCFFCLPQEATARLNLNSESGGGLRHPSPKQLLSAVRPHPLWQGELEVDSTLSHLWELLSLQLSQISQISQLAPLC